ncbi:DegQ family serine endoprotease [Campylobacter sp. CCS1377]|uniref:DegQ family serine endoprotease n=1 Tax=Campylobacter sp. CCS1377 TaxID=3158229 RepID=A0AAU7E995_9BACT|nr:DegQ family serine endoprotease [Campylobacter jejuni]
MLKKIILSTTIASCLFAANIAFNEADSKVERIDANGQNSGVLSYHNAIKDVKKSVVNISTSRTVTRSNQLGIEDFFNDPYFKQFFGFNFPQPQNKPNKEVVNSLGSGVVISDNGYIITNNHVVENADVINVSLPDSDIEYKAKLIGTDPKTDLAVIKIEANNLSAVTFADSDELMEGDVVFALGNPFGVGSSVTSGIISALNKNNIGLNQYENFIQTDASINPGNSGGALVDSRGYLVGINSAILSRGGGNNGIGFAIPSNMAKDIAKKLIEKGKVERGILGVTIAALSKDSKKVYKNQEGALITSVEKGSSADIGGLKRGDLVLKVNEKTIKNPTDLKNYIGTLEPNKKLTVSYERDGNINTTSFVLKGDKDSSGIVKDVIQGLKLHELDANLRSRLKIPTNINGVVVVEVAQKSKAFELGFKAGDLIIAVEQTEIKNLKELEQALNKLAKNTPAKIWIYRDGYAQLLILK